MITMYKNMFKDVTAEVIPVSTTLPSDILFIKSVLTRQKCIRCLIVSGRKPIWLVDVTDDSFIVSSSQDATKEQATAKCSGTIFVFIEDCL